jgi:hypothetical protein
MTSPNTPKLLKGGIVLMDPGSGAVLRIVSLQYNPERVTRSLQVQGLESSGGDRSEALRLTGPPIETIRLEAEIDATDHLENTDVPGGRAIAEFGIQPQLAALETIIYPTSGHLRQLEAQSSAGSLEVAAQQSPLTIFVWSKSRIAPVRITEFSIEEQFFDANLNPIRAKLSLAMRVLNVNDLGFQHRGGNLFMIYQQQKEQLAARSVGGAFSTLGIAGITT